MYYVVKIKTHSLEFKSKRTSNNLVALLKSKIGALQVIKMRSNAATTLDHELLKSEVSLHYAIVVTVQYSNMFCSKTVIASYVNISKNQEA